MSEYEYDELVRDAEETNRHIANTRADGWLDTPDYREPPAWVHLTTPTFIVKDSGARQHFASGMQRDTATDKVDYTLALDGPMFDRYAAHLTKGAVKYQPRNWMKAEGQAELDRFRQSALRHFLQWFRGETDEDHAAATWFNINGAEFTKDKLDGLL